MTCIWLVTSFDFYLINFLISSFKEAYNTAIASQLSEMSGQILSGFVFALVGTKRGLFFSFGMSFCAGLFILFHGLQNQTHWTFLLQILIAKFGIASAFNIIYLAHDGLFPVMFAASSFGYCNFFARTFTIASPLLARIE